MMPSMDELLSVLDRAAKAEALGADLHARLNGADQRASAYLRERDELRAEVEALKARAAKDAEYAATLVRERDEARTGWDNWREACRKAEAERDAIPDHSHELRELRAELAKMTEWRNKAERAAAAAARMREALEACSYWLHPAGFNAERQRLFDRITEGVANSHSLWNFIRAALGNDERAIATWLDGIRSTERDTLRTELAIAKADNVRLRGLQPELPPFPPSGSGLPRYGLRWEGDPKQPLAVPMEDGYWTPAHLATAELALAKAGEANALAQRDACAADAMRLREVAERTLKHAEAMIPAPDGSTVVRMVRRAIARSAEPRAQTGLMSESSQFTGGVRDDSLDPGVRPIGEPKEPTR